MAFYWNEKDREDQEFRRGINAGRIYTENACCDFCGVSLRDGAIQCDKCDALACTQCICNDGCCPTCTRAGDEGIPGV